MRGNSALAQNHFVGVNVVVNRVETFDGADTGALEQNFSHAFTVQPREMLTNFHVVQVLRQIFPVNKAQIVRRLRMLLPEIPVQFLNRFLNFTAPPSRLVLADNFFLRLEHFLLAYRQIYRHFLVNFRDLLAQIPAAAVNHQIKSPVARAVNLYEMVAAAQSANAPLNAPRILQAAIAKQILQLESFAATFPDIFAGRNFMRRLVELFKVNRIRVQLNREHSAANVNADDVGNRLIADSHRRANRTARARVHVRHNPNLTAARKFVVAHSPNLFARLVLHFLGERNRRVHFADNFFHKNPSKNFFAKIIPENVAIFRAFK